MADHPKQPVIILLTSHWIAMAGVSLVALAGISWLFVLPENIRGNAGNPYIGLLAFIAIPVVFFAGLALIPVGIAMGRKSAAAAIGAAPDRRAAWRRAGFFFAIMTMANLVIGSQLTYRAVEHMETVQFCGQSCHVMKPEFTAHLLQPHQAVSCASCHIGPGAKGWLNAKMAGTRQLVEVVLNSYPRPIEAGLESNRLVSSADTCEQCHAREKFIGPRLYIHSEFKDDAANTRTESVLTMRVGGSSLGGIHGAHLGPGVRIRYAAADKKRETIPWVEYSNTSTGVSRTYLASGTTPDAISSLPMFEMQCADCHNRAAHSLESPEHAVDRALAESRISASLPFVKKTAVALLKTAYTSEDEAAQQIPAGLSAFYRQNYGDVAAQRSSDVQAAGQALAAIYRSNVFPDLKVTWGTYPNHLGHTDDPGCFRCHDDSHATAGKKTITQDCSVCHELLATQETAPAILKTLGLSDLIAVQKH